MLFLFNWVIFRFQPLILRVVMQVGCLRGFSVTSKRCPRWWTVTMWCRQDDGKIMCLFFEIRQGGQEVDPRPCWIREILMQAVKHFASQRTADPKEQQKEAGSALFLKSIGTTSALTVLDVLDHVGPIIFFTPSIWGHVDGNQDETKPGW